MATTSIWSVKGWLGKVVVYVENPDKTVNPKFYEKQDMSNRDTQGLSDVISYAVNVDKTRQTDDENDNVMQSFVSGINCYPATARDEMFAVKKRFGKNEGVMAYHGYQSFAEGEVLPEQAHKIGVRLAKKLWGEKYQVVVATHLDKKNHLHIKIKHNDTYETLYAHCSKIAVSYGQEVKKGQIIGYVGTTGNSTGNHLHFEVYKDGERTNPLKYFR